jgi:hypothetical protein
MKYIHLISGPRNISTACMYSFAQRSDTVVKDEPYYAVYLLRSGVTHPDSEAVLASQPNTEDEVHEQLLSCREKPVVFIKNMAHHLEVLDKKEVLQSMTPFFLIRNPRQIIASYSQVIEKPVMRDIGIEYQHEVFTKALQRGQKPVVVDSGLLLENPPGVLRKLCQALEIPFESSMLHWQAGPKPYDGVWAPYWYSNVHQSTGFVKQPTSERPLRDDLVPLYERAHEFYQQLLPHAIKA